MLGFGVSQFLDATQYNNQYVQTTEYFETWKYNYYQELGDLSAPAINFDAIPKPNNTLVLCDTITSDFLLSGTYTQTQCLENVCIQQGGCLPSNYVCESSICLIQQQQEVCAAQMALIGCTVTYSLKTLYACPNYPTEVITECAQTCPDIQCTGYGSRNCTNCTQSGLRVFNFEKNTYLTIAGQFRYSANNLIVNSSQLYTFECTDPQNCGIVQLLPTMNLQGHIVDYACWWQGCVPNAIEPITFYYDINDPSQTINDLTSTDGPITSITFGVIFTFVAVMTLIISLFYCCGICGTIWSVPERFNWWEYYCCCQWCDPPPIQQKPRSVITPQPMYPTITPTAPSLPTIHLEIHS